MVCYMIFLILIQINNKNLNKHALKILQFYLIISKNLFLSINNIYTLAFSTKICFPRNVTVFKVFSLTKQKNFIII